MGRGAAQRRVREPLEMIEFARRAIRAAGRHTANADEFELAELASLRAELDEVIRAAVAGQRSHGRSWAYIGAALGIKRQTAQERYGERVAS